MIDMLIELWVTSGENMCVEVLANGACAYTLTKVLINMLAAAMVSVGMGMLTDEKVVVVTSALIGLDLELVVAWSYVVEVMSGDWSEAVIEIDVSIGIDILARE